MFKHHYHQLKLFKAKPKKGEVLGLFRLCMINVAAIISLRNLPLISKYDFASVFFYHVAALIFFLPLSLQPHGQKKVAYIHG